VVALAVDGVAALVEIGVGAGGAGSGVTVAAGGDAVDLTVAGAVEVGDAAGIVEDVDVVLREEVLGRVVSFPQLARRLLLTDLVFGFLDMFPYLIFSTLYPCIMQRCFLCYCLQ
jgi:hypothetical protein